MANDVHFHINMPNGSNSTNPVKGKGKPSSSSPTPKAQKPGNPQPRSNLKPTASPQVNTPKAAPKPHKTPPTQAIASGMQGKGKPTGKPTSNAKGPSVSGQPVAQQGKGTQSGPQQGPLLGTMQSQNFPGLAGERQQQPNPPVPKKPMKEPKAPPDVQQARAQQDAVLKTRQARETQGKMKSAPREVNAGAGSWPVLSPLL